MRVEIIFQKQMPTGGYEPFKLYKQRVNAGIESLEEKGFVILAEDKLAKDKSAERKLAFSRIAFSIVSFIVLSSLSHSNNNLPKIDLI